MPFVANVIRVFIASPGDLAAERDIVCEVIHDWNGTHSSRQGIVLLPVRWEDDSYPVIGTRAQEAINEQILVDCDLLVAMFWKKLGTATGRKKSGTVEEIDVHTDAGKPAMLYFSKAPFTPSAEDFEKFAELEAFKKKCQPKDFYQEYKNVDEFRQLFTSQLSKIIYVHFSQLSTSAVSQAKPEPPKQISISPDAVRILLAATEEGRAQGTIITVSSMRNILVQAGMTVIINGGTPIEAATWRDAIKELSDNNLIQDQGHKRENFQVTSPGYALAAQIRDSQQKSS